MNARDAATACGIVGPLVAAVGILAATAVDPSFQWAASALSDTGAHAPGQAVDPSFLRSNPEFLLFNGGLVLTGSIGLPFAWSLWDGADHWVQRAGAVWFALAMLAMALVGVFHLPHSLHGAAAIGHYLAATMTLWTYGTGSVLAGRRLRGLATVWLGCVHLLFWIVWALVLQSGPLPGLAVPETVGAALFGGWVFATARRRLARSPRRGAAAERTSGL